MTFTDLCICFCFCILSTEEIRNDFVALIVIAKSPIMPDWQWFETHFEVFLWESWQLQSVMNQRIYQSTLVWIRGNFCKESDRGSLGNPKDRVSDRRRGELEVLLWWSCRTDTSSCLVQESGGVSFASEDREACQRSF